MKYNNAESWKTQMKRIAEEQNKSPQDIQQRYILEEFARKISKSSYKNTMILKGGFIVSTLLGMDARMTRDLDLTFKSINYSKEEMLIIMEEIIKVSSEGLFDFRIKSIETSQIKNDQYGYVIKMIALFDNIRLDFKLDVSANTLIYPDAIQNHLKSFFVNEDIDIMSYPIENIIAEKFETTLDRGEANGRIRDVTDVYMLLKEHSLVIDYTLLMETVIKVSENRGTINNLFEYQNILNFLSSSEIFNQTFNDYVTKSNLQNISLKDCFQVFYRLGEDTNLFLQQKKKL